MSLTCLKALHYLKSSRVMFCKRTPVINSRKRTLSTKPEGDSQRELEADARRIFDVAVTSVIPVNMVQDNLRLDGDTLHVTSRSYDVARRGVHVVGFGKAVLGMVRAAEDILGDRIVGGVACVPHGITDTFRQLGKNFLIPSPGCKVAIREGAKDNIPDQEAFEAAKEIETLLSRLGEDDVVLTLISGGGSALLPYPTPPLTLEEMATVTRLLSRSGATIQQLNIIRKHLEVLKGGGLAKTAAPAEMATLIISDVVGDDLDYIASGPTVPDLFTPGQSLAQIDKLGLTDSVPASVLEVLRAKQISFQASAGDGHGSGFPLVKVHNVLVGTNQMALEAARDEAERLGYIPVILTSQLSGNVKNVTFKYIKVLRFIMEKMFGASSLNECDVEKTHANMELELVASGVAKSKVNEIRAAASRGRNSNTPVCLLAGGEITVEVTGGGQGGRNQQMALDIAISLDRTIAAGRLEHSPVFLSAGTDGQDGPTDATGAIVDLDTVPEAQKQGLDPVSYAQSNNSYSFFSALSDGRFHLVTGLTGTNVMDIQVILIKPNPVVL